MVFYFVQRGETLYTIAKRYQTTVHAIVAANRLEDPNAICPGQALIIPRPGEVPSPPPGGVVHLVRPGETLFTLADQFGSTVREILLANQIAHPEFVAAGQQLVIPESAEPGEDWPMLGRTPGRTGATVVKLTGVPTAAWTYAPRRSLLLQPSAPVTRYERVYVGLGDGCFYAFDQLSGSVKWRVRAYDGERTAYGEQGAMVTPAIYDGLAYLCGLDGTLRALDAHSGRAVWQVALGVQLTGAPVAADGIIYCGSQAGDVFAVEAKAGAVVWREQLDGAISQPVALGDDLVLAITDSGSLWALEALTGKRLWQTPCEASSAPVFAELLVLVGGTAFDPTTGQVVWRRAAAGCAPVSRVDQVFYPGVLVDLFTGEARSATEEPALPVRSQVLAGELQLLVTDDQRLIGWDTSAGRERWQVELDSGATGGLAVAPDIIFLTHTDGSLTAYRSEAEG